MGESIDFSMLRRSPRASLDPIIEALDGFAKSRNAKKRQDEELAFRREQLAQRDQIEQRLISSTANNRARDEAKQNLAERRFVGDQTVRNSRNEAALNDQVRGDIANRDYGRAQQRSDSYSYPDPETGEVKKGLPGFKVDRGTRPEMPESPVEYGPREAPPEPRAPVEEGPQATSGIANRAGKIRAEEASFEPNAGSDIEYADAAQDERRRFNAQQATSPDVPPGADPRAAERERFARQNTAPKDVAMALYQRQAEAYGRKQPDQPVTGEGMDADGNIGPAEIAPGSRERPDITIAGVPTNPDDLRYSAGRAEAEDFKRIGSVLQAQFEQAVQTRDPQTQAAAQRKMEIFAQLAPQVETGRVPAAKAMQALMGATTAENQRGATLEQTVLRGEQGQRRAETMAAAAADRAREAGTRSAADKHGGVDPQVENMKLSRIRTFNAEVENMAKRHDLPADTRNLQRAAMNIDSANSDNSVLQAAAQFGVARDITGGGGQSLSNKDVAMVAPRAGGMERLQGLAGRFLDGDPLSDSEKKVLADGIRHGMDFAKKRLAAFQDDYIATFDNDDLPWRAQLGRQHIMGALRRYIPQSENPARGAVRPGSNARPSDPDDANGPGASAPLNPDEAPPRGNKQPTRQMIDAAAKSPRVRAGLEERGYVFQ